MRSKTVLSLLLLVVVLTGCQVPIKVEPLEFHHGDEVRQEGEFMVLADRRVFAVMAFLNVCGFDEEVAGKEMHPVRKKVRDALLARAAQHPEAWARWKAYYQKRPSQTFGYQDYALSLCDDYPFKRIRPDHEVGYAFMVKALAGFSQILNEFWETLDVEQVWEEVKADYLADIGQYDFQRMNHQLAFVWEYLRLERKDCFTFVTVPNLMDRYYHAIGAQYENYWFMVESPGAVSYGMNVHEYLHSMINSMMDRCYEDHCTKLNAYCSAGKGMPLAKSYSIPQVYAWECLVRALDHRIGGLMSGESSVLEAEQRRIEYLNRDGLFLVQPFYELLDDYEASEMNFEEFLPVMLERLPEYSIDKE